MADIPVVEAEPGGAAEAGTAKTRPRGRRLRPVAAVVAVLAALGLALFALTRPAVEPVVEVPAEPAPPGLIPAPQDGGAGFVLEVAGAQGGSLVVPYDTFAVTALPGDTLALRVRYTASAQVVASGGALQDAGPLQWTWTPPPTPGVTRIDLEAADSRQMRLHAVTLVPFDHADDAIGDYAIGDYQDEPLGGDPVYDEPAGFVRVPPDLEDVPVSPHFRLGQFLAKQEADGPKYLLLEPALLFKLERLLAAVRTAGVPADGLTVMSGYRTPAYNAAVGNTTVYSRHLYGDAADVFVDTDGDGMMDDLDGDGSVTETDAEWLAALVEGVVAEHSHLEGGLGIYGPAPHRGPFVHVDTRGTAVRW